MSHRDGDEIRARAIQHLVLFCFEHPSHGDRLAVTLLQNLSGQFWLLSDANEPTNTRVSRIQENQR